MSVTVITALEMVRHPRVMGGLTQRSYGTGMMDAQAVHVYDVRGTAPVRSRYQRHRRNVKRIQCPLLPPLTHYSNVQNNPNQPLSLSLSHSLSIYIVIFYRYIWDIIMKGQSTWGGWGADSYFWQQLHGCCCPHDLQSNHRTRVLWSSMVGAWFLWSSSLIQYFCFQPYFDFEISLSFLIICYQS